MKKIFYKAIDKITLICYTQNELRSLMLVYQHSSETNTLIISLSIFIKSSKIRHLRRRVWRYPKQIRFIWLFSIAKRRCFFISLYHICCV